MVTEARLPQTMTGMRGKTRKTAIKTTLSSGSTVKKEREVRPYTEVVAE